MNSTVYFTALLLGLMGAGHCLAMCGGIISSLSISVDQSQNQRTWRFIIMYQFGRISSYAIFGGIVGLLGYQFQQMNSLPILKFISGLLLIGMFLYLTRIWLVLSYMEKLGHRLWVKISPLSRRLLLVNSNKQAFLLGAVWGWLPCGLVYTSLGYALSLGDASNSALFMLIFGLGTLPATLLAGSASLTLKQYLNHSLVRYLSALIFLLLALYTFYSIFFSPADHYHH